MRDPVALTPGTRLGPYEIDAPIGAGGMGEVYRARDLRLDRVVAIKTLPAEFGRGAASRERFDREARIVATFNHPHICRLYDVGSDYLVLEYLDGESLAERLARGPLPVALALRLAAQVADALNRAHRAGVVHRDLKPANIFLVADGAPCAKLLDFGIAKLAPAVPSSPTAATSAAATPAVTAKHTILGTYQYMAPEQIEGREADSRSDIFAFGAVLYEMITGRRAFEGTDVTLLTAIVERHPAPMASFRRQVPPALQHIVDRCLAKDPDARWQSARDVAAELEWVASGSADAGSAPAIKRHPLIWLAGAAVTAAFAIAVLLPLMRARQTADVRVLKFDVLTPPRGMTVKGAAAPPAHFAVAPDGQRLAYVAGDDAGRNVLWIHAFDGQADAAVASTTGASYPFWSPDSRSVGFFADGKLKRVDVGSGSIQTICDAPDNRGGAWGPDDDIVVAPITGDVLYRVSAQGGPKTPVTRMDRSRNETAHRWPVFLPDGRHFLFLVSRNPEITEIDIGSLDGTRINAVVESPFHAVYGSGYLLFAREGVLFAQPFDATRLIVTGRPVIAAPRVIGNQQYHGAFDVSASGMLVYQPMSPTISRPVWVDRRGAPIETVGSADDYIDVELSPDGRKIAFARTDPKYGVPNVWIRDLTSGQETRMTSSHSYESSPLWSPDGSRLIFRSAMTGLSDLFIKDVAGGRAEPLLLTDRNKVDTSWSPDGRFVLFHAAFAGKGRDIWMLPLDGPRTPRPFLDSPFNELAARVSPDGHYVAYLSDESGAQQLYVTTFPQPGAAWQVSSDGAFQPRWGRGGRELYFISPTRTMMSAAVRVTGQTIAVDKPAPLFQAAVPNLENAYRTDYTVSADGERFLIVTLDQNAISSLTVTTSWIRAMTAARAR
jgi:Tol biopolymer transport system component